MGVVVRRYIDPAKKKKEFEDFAKVIEDSKSYEGFFKLYQKKENLEGRTRPDRNPDAVEKIGSFHAQIVEGQISAIKIHTSGTCTRCACEATI